MPYGIENASTSQGTNIDFEVHKGPLGLAGVVAHWGETIEANDLRDRINTVYPDKKLPEDTGFDRIYHQRDGISRSDGIADELEVATLVGNKTLEVNGWDPKDIAGLFVGSGVPIADDPRYTNYAAAIADRLGLSPDTVLHSTYAACNSGAREVFNALEHPDMQGKPVIVMGMEGITELTGNFDPKKADHLSMQVFSNGAAGIGMVPGENISLLHHGHRVIEDKRNALTAHMTYGQLLDADGEIWQDKGPLSLMRYPLPEDGKLIEMDGSQTVLFFVRNGVVFLSDMLKDYLAKYPDQLPDYGAAHHPSLGVHTVLGQRLAKEGIDIEFPWVVNDGNSSAATSMIAQLRLLERAQEGTKVLYAAYGAGGSFDAGVLMHAGHAQALSIK